jgi:L,D-transpeptidase YcfS
MLGRLFCLLLVFPLLSQAATFVLPEDGSNVIGKSKVHIVEAKQTFAEIADIHHVGFLALMAANPGVDPYLPGEGVILDLPTQMILPNAPRKGIVVNLAELRLYYYDPNGKDVHVFPVGIGAIGRETPTMTTYVNEIIDGPSWTPTASIRKRYAAQGIELPKTVPPGPENPLGNHALRLAYGYGQYLIHGTNKEFGIGLRVSSGCIRMQPPHIEWLFNQVSYKTPVAIVNDPVKVAYENNSLFVEVHEPLTNDDGYKVSPEATLELEMWLEQNPKDSALVSGMLATQTGIPQLL